MHSTIVSVVVHATTVVLYCLYIFSQYTLCHTCLVIQSLFITTERT
jgi:hypothetical protein